MSEGVAIEEAPLSADELRRADLIDKIREIAGKARGHSGVIVQGGQPRREWEHLTPHEWARAADRMLLDARVRNALTIRDAGMAGAAYTVTPSNSGTERATVLAEHVRAVLGLDGEPGLMLSFKRFIKEARRYIHYGSLLFEVIWEAVDPRTGWSVPVEIAARLPSSILRWGDGDELGPVLQRTPSGSVELPGSKLLLFSMGRISSDWLGLAASRSAWGPWTRMNEAIDLRMSGLARRGMTPAKVKSDPAGAMRSSISEGLLTKLTADAVEGVVAAMSGQNPVIVDTPGVVETDFGSADGFDGAAYLAAEAREVENIYAAYSVEFLRMGINGSGNRSLGEVHMDLLRRIIVDDVEEICDTMNGPWRPGGGLVGALCELNFGVGDPRDLPTITVTGLDPQPLLEALAQLGSLKDSGWLTPQDADENTLRRAMRMPLFEGERDSAERMRAAQGGGGLASLFAAKTGGGSDGV